MLCYNIADTKRPVNPERSPAVRNGQATIISLDAARAETRRRGDGGCAEPLLQAEPLLETDHSEIAKDARRVRWSLVAAIVIHCSAALAFWLGVLDSKPEGGGGQYLESISVDLVPSQVLESRRPSRPDEHGGGSVAELANANGDREQTAEKPIEQETEKSAVKAEEVQKQSADSVPLAPKPVELPKAKETAQAKGATVSALVNSSAASAAGAAASPGEISRYAAKVREALARNRPHGLTHKGTTTIAFAIDKSGKLVFARITDSSGELSVDDAVLAAVRRTVFPLPPQDMAARQLSYVVPFRFK